MVFTFNSCTQYLMADSDIFRKWHRFVLLLLLLSLLLLLLTPFKIHILKIGILLLLRDGNVGPILISDLIVMEFCTQKMNIDLLIAWPFL